MFCPKCGTKNVDNARFCIQCGHSYTNKQKKNRWWMAGIILTLFLVCGGFIYYFVLNKEFNNETVVKEITPTQIESEVNSTKPEKQPTVEKDPKTNTSTNVEKKKKATNQKAATQKDKKDIIRDAQTKVFTILTADSQGSGFLFQENGTVVTNAHVVAGYIDVMVRDQNGREMNGKVIGISNQYDVALIQIQDLAGTPPLEMEMKESEIGSEVIALGSPQGLENTASIGYLTGLDRSFVSDFQYENVYQIDAQVSPGSSGGPLLDGKTGKVIGINSALLTRDESIAFSIPMYTMKDLLTSWSKSPMDKYDVANTFDFYNEYVAYDEYEYGDSFENEDYESEEEAYDSAFDEASLSDFILNFRSDYELALTSEDFSYIEDLLLYDSQAYYEMSDYIDEISGQGMVFNFTSNEVTNIDMQAEQAIVSTFEVFDFMNAAGEWSVYERIKDYVVVIDENGYYKIMDIEIHQ
ncbi:trypsin-like peptidase domain-containing protein [Pseudalkalibacillus hwajinpoensis]|uniref:Trypsin-like serine protease n=1 Tax=Guptibacillus hwajinpoensis TaxID=208199 RepID=A0A4U1MFP7_9BACL|nr:trypsin-like peptidase domain-containing protein [Pseudalkalibacillus hwajinpoensis]TKD69215.1 trypsin-like serine protease [Pseudalkalibacillus hwajinpoensis]